MPFISKAFSKYVRKFLSLFMLIFEGGLYDCYVDYAKIKSKYVGQRATSSSLNFNAWAISMSSISLA